jgi:hypothetical protein
MPALEEGLKVPANLLLHQPRIPNTEPSSFLTVSKPTFCPASAPARMKGSSTPPGAQARPTLTDLLLSRARSNSSNLALQPRTLGQSSTLRAEAGATRKKLRVSLRLWTTVLEKLWQKAQKKGLATPSHEAAEDIP